MIVFETLEKKKAALKTKSEEAERAKQDLQTLQVSARNANDEQEGVLERARITLTEKRAAHEHEAKRYSKKASGSRANNSQ